MSGPFLDVSGLTLDPDLADTITVLRRPEVVTTGGLSTVPSPVTYSNVSAVVQPEGDENLDRTADYDITSKQIVVVTKFRLQATSPGYKPDLVQWPQGSGSYYIVDRVEDYSGYGGGQIEAHCTSTAYQDPPPQA